MKVFEVRAPDGRLVRHHHGSLEEARKAVVAGYYVTGEVLGASADMTGGFLDPCGPGSESFMKTLLDNRGDELAAWMLAQGFIKALPWKEVEDGLIQDGITGSITVPRNNGKHGVLKQDAFGQASSGKVDVL